jgi:hypothetical protein
VRVVLSLRILDRAKSGNRSLDVRTRTTEWRNTGSVFFVVVT